MEHYTDLTVKQFVDSSADIRWCPYPDCNYAICIKRDSKKEDSIKKKSAKEDEAVGGAEGGAVGGDMEKVLTCGENVECGQGHGFCW